MTATTTPMQEPRRNTVARYISALTHGDGQESFNVPTEEELAKLPEGRWHLRDFAKRYVAASKHLVK